MWEYFLIVWAAEAPFSCNLIQLPRGNIRINISRKFNLFEVILFLPKLRLQLMDGWDESLFQILIKRVQLLV